MNGGRWLAALALAIARGDAALGQAVERPAGTVRIATFNASLHRPAAGDLVRDLAGGEDARARAVAEIVQRVAPDVLLLNEVDHDAAGEAVRLLRERYLAVAWNGAAALEYPHVFLAPSNTGEDSGFDLDRDGERGGPGDAFGYGAHPGQYGMVLLSRLPLDADAARTFRTLRWRDMPGALLPDDPATPAAADWYSDEALAVLRLSSKSHWDVPVSLPDGRTLHVLCAHPTPPVFDGPPRFPAEVDFNGRRNHDEIRFWADYLAPERASWIRDDAGRSGGLARGPYVILGDHNADPEDGEPLAREAWRLVRASGAALEPAPRSAGAAQAAARQGGANARHRGDPACDTADFGDRDAGNLRADVVLPSPDLEVVASGVFWPGADDPLFRLVGDGGAVSSDHRLVWIDVRAKGEHGDGR